MKLNQKEWFIISPIRSHTIVASLGVKLSSSCKQAEKILQEADSLLKIAKREVFHPADIFLQCIYIFKLKRGRRNVREDKARILIFDAENRVDLLVPQTGTAHATSRTSSV